MNIKTPFVAVDGIIKIFEEGKFRGIVLIKRKNPPLGLALPGGFVEIGESVEKALVREMKEETGLNVNIEKLLGVYSDPQRDPRFHAISLVFICKASGVPKGMDDAKEAVIYKIEDIPYDSLVFDHKKILMDFVGAL